MARFCTNCGTELAEGMAFCTSCGTKAEDTAVAAPPPVEETVVTQTEEIAPEPAKEVVTPTPTVIPPPPPQQQPTPQPRAQQYNGGYTQPQGQYGTGTNTYYGQPSYSPPVNQQPAPQEKPTAFKPVSTGGFFGLILLFALPIIGQLACIIMAFAPKNPNLKNYARANLIWLIIGLVFAILIGILVAILGHALFDFLGGLSLGSGLEDLLGQLGELGQ